jgi:NTP pyrophosphatase (non-canonical NTP hydrolase)
MDDAFNYREEVLKTAAVHDADPLEKKLSLGGLGVAGEGGEVADVVKKILHHGRSFESMRDNLIKEMGDVEWYLEFLCNAIGVTREEVQRANIKKLRERYAKGSFNTEESIAKKDEDKAIKPGSLKPGDKVKLKADQHPYGVEPGEVATVKEVNPDDPTSFNIVEYGAGRTPDIERYNYYDCHILCWEKP